MIDIFFLAIILSFLIYTIFQKIETMKDHNFEYLNSKSSTFIKNDVYALNESIEIKNLSKCKKIINFDYGVNYNFIINNNISIYQDIIDPLQHTIDIDNVNYNLTSIRWKRSKLLYDGKPIGLEMHLVHQNFNSIYKLTIVIPLDLTNNTNNNTNDNNDNNDNNTIDNNNTNDNDNDNDNTNNNTNNNDNNDNNTIETFKNLNYIKMTKAYNVYTDTILNDNENKNFSDALYFQKEKNMDLVIKNLKNTFNLNKKYDNTNHSLNKLIPSKNLLPDYECCKDTIGPKKSFDFCDLQEICTINNDSMYHQLEDRDGNMYLINEPVQFDENVGLYLMNKIVYDDLTVFIKDKN